MRKMWKSAAMACAASMAIVLGACTQARSSAGDGAATVPAIEKTRSATFIYEEGTEWQPAGENVVRQVMGYDGQVMLVKVKFLVAGAEGTPHTHYHTQTTYVASGRFEFTIGGEKRVVSAGDGLYMEPDVLHGCVCLEPGVLIDCFSPMRADFLK